MIQLKTKKEIDLMRRCNQILAETRQELISLVKPGVTTLELDRVAEDLIRKKGGKSAFKGYRGFPGTICASVNDAVVHGIPNKRPLKDGDILGIDMGVIYEGFYGDSAVTIPVGKVSAEAERLLKVTREALELAIMAAQPGARLNDIGATVQEHAEKAGYSVVREFVGHGIGRSLHEEPQIPNYGTRGTGPKLQPGLVIAIEPMINEGGPDIRILEDGWTAVTADGKLSAHFEHSIAITEEGPEILSQLH